MSEGLAGRTNYREWDKVASNLAKADEENEEKEKEESAKKLGLDGKYAFSEAEKEERQKAKDAAHTKRVLDGYRKREAETMQTFSGILGPVEKDEEGKTDGPTTVRVTRDRMGAGKRVITLCDTSGESQKDLIVFTQDLSHLESMATMGSVMPKSYPEDADNGVKNRGQRTVAGVIKLFISNVHNCTVSLRCKIISGTVELIHCSNVVLKIEKDATVATLQCDLCKQIAVEFHDAPSGKSMLDIPGQPRLFWGDDKNDRVFHAGVSDMSISLHRDGYVECRTDVDYMRDGAETVGNATPEEFQFVTSVVDGDLSTERVIRHGGTTGKNARAMTQRELDAEKERRETVAQIALEKAESMIKILDKDGKEVPVVQKDTPIKKQEEKDEIEEVYTSMSKAEIDSIVAECEQNKTRGNEAFRVGEYAQAILLYSLALDKADELPDKEAKGKKQLFQRHVVFANRSAAFLKLGNHPKALADGTRAHALDPTYVKGIFRQGLALHALGQYSEAVPVLAEAHKLEPNNKQIKQALQFAEVRMTQEMRKRMEQRT